MTGVEGKGQCQICKKPFNNSDLIFAAVVRPTVVEVIKKKYPTWDSEGKICKIDLDNFRRQYIQGVLETEKGELSKLDHDVIRSLTQHEIISKRPDKDKTHYNFGERLSDKIASFGGSWTFIIIFLLVLAAWITVNSYVLLAKPFDPFPFILMNLILSCIAALQAPVIMMSQNRQEKKDRIHAEHDYKVNLKAELEIRHLHEKMDHLLHSQWTRLLEIQEMQVELMDSAKRERKKE
jgi:uncharacterized membrane protein